MTHSGRIIKNLYSKIISNKFILFLISNLIYSISTFIINLLLPVILSKSIFNEFIYLFQMNLFMISMSGLGLTTGLLKNHLLNREETHTQFTISGVIISIILLILGLFPNNPISIGIKIHSLSFFQHLLFYISVILTNLFLFNRAILNSEKLFINMLRSVSFITILRLLGLYFIAIYFSDSIAMSLIILFILPFLFELLFFLRKTIQSLRKHPFDFGGKYLAFIYFCLQVFITGALFVLADRLFLIYIKGQNEYLSGVLSFAYGFIGVISVFNMSFTNYFLGKINPNDIKEIVQFKDNILRFFSRFFLATTLISMILSFFIYIAYSDIAYTLIPILIILIFKTAFTSYFGFTNILSKTLSIQHLDLIINIIRVVTVYLVINFSKRYNIDFITLLIIISLIMIIGEFILFILVLKKIKNTHNSEIN